MAGASASVSTAPGAEQNPSVPLPHCPPNPAAAIAAATMPKQKEAESAATAAAAPTARRDETGDEEDGEPHR